MKPPFLTRGVALLFVLVGCEHYVPARFADRPVVTRMEDDRPIPVPSYASFDERAQLSDIYLRRPLFDLVRPLEFGTAGDVNAMDEVPASTWFDPERRGEIEGRSLPPRLPLTVLDENPVVNEDALVVADANDAHYELVADPLHHAGLVTGAEVLGGYLVRSLGLHAPASWVLGVPDADLMAVGEKQTGRLEAWRHGKEPPEANGRRVAATRWPGGIDVGITGDFAARSDDPNDTVDHNDRRTLRAMKLFGEWLGFTNFGVRNARDVYVGKPGEGHVVHYVVGLGHALGTRELRDEPTRDEQAGNGWQHLITFGLAPPVWHAPRRGALPSLGYLPAHVGPGGYSVSPPYSPFVRTMPPDEYWAAKLLAGRTVQKAIAAGIAAAQLPRGAGPELASVLERRRRDLVRRAMRGVAPLDVEGVEGRQIRVRDRALGAGVESKTGTRYEVSYLGSEGSDVAPSLMVPATAAITALPLPKEVVGDIVLRVIVHRGRDPASRACDIHVVSTVRSVRVIGVRH